MCMSSNILKGEVMKKILVLAVALQVMGLASAAQANISDGIQKLGPWIHFGTSAPIHHPTRPHK